jgi:hypothetical protein
VARHPAFEGSEGTAEVGEGMRWQCEVGCGCYGLTQPIRVRECDLLQELCALAKVSYISFRFGEVALRVPPNGLRRKQSIVAVVFMSPPIQYSLRGIFF